MTTPSPKPVFRLLTADDEAAYVALRQEMLADSPWAFGSSPEDDRTSNPGWLAGYLGTPDHVIVVAEEGGKLIAAAGLGRDTHLKSHHMAHVWGVYTTPSARGTGVGRRVMELLVQTARSWGGIEVISLSVSERSPEAKRVYERVGFEQWGTQPDMIRICGDSYCEHHMQLAL